jgi:hypothetical protein
METAKGLANVASTNSKNANEAMGKSRAAAIAAHNAFVKHAEGSYTAGNF